jgi:hypothetical protein
MNDRIRLLAEQSGFVFWVDEECNPRNSIDWTSNYDQEIVKYTKLVVRQSLVDFYRRHLDTNSNEDIAGQVDRYTNEQFGITDD